ncbi:MAG: hypothetical protein ACRD68_17320, partial [Pyrinomonadaceae bacterium]
MNGGKALQRVGNNGSYLDSTNFKQGASTLDAQTVRGVRSYYVEPASAGSPLADTSHSSYANLPKSTNGALIPPGAGIKGRILIEIVKADGTTYDVTEEILSMG